MTLSRIPTFPSVTMMVVFALACADPDDALDGVDEPVVPAPAALAASTACASMAPIASRTAPAPGDGGAAPLPLVFIDAATGGNRCAEPALPPVRACANDGRCRNVVASGADGGDGRDDTAAIQRAVDGLAPGGVLYFPPGRYIVNADLRPDVLPTAAGFGVQLRAKTDIHVVGASSATSVIVDRFPLAAFATLPSSSPLQVGSFRIVGGRDITIANLGFESATGYACDLASYAGRVSGVYATSVTNLAIVQVEARSYNRAGVYVTGTSAAPSVNPYIADDLLQQNRVAGLVLGWTRGARVEQNRFYNNGRKGDQGVGYGSAGWSTETPTDTLERCNLADYNVRKGLDFHSALGATTLVTNTSVGSGIAGIFVSGNADRLGGTITIADNRVRAMSPAITTGRHGIPPGDVAAGVVGIWTYPKFTVASSTTPTIVIRGNTITDFTGADGTIRFSPFQLRSEAFSTGTTTVERNVVHAGTIHQLINTNTPPVPAGAPPGAQTITIVNNTDVSYAQLTWSSLISLSQVRTVKVASNRIVAVPAATSDDRWDDAETTRRRCQHRPQLDVVSSQAPAPTPVGCTIGGNVWLR